MEVNELQDLVTACREHVLVMHDKVDDLKASDASEGNADDKEDIPEGYSGYVDGAYQGALLNMFNATHLLGDKIAAAAAG